MGDEYLFPGVPPIYEKSLLTWPGIIRIGNSVKTDIGHIFIYASLSSINAMKRKDVLSFMRPYVFIDDQVFSGSPTKTLSYIS